MRRRHRSRLWGAGLETLLHLHLLVIQSQFCGVSFAVVSFAVNFDTRSALGRLAAYPLAHICTQHLLVRGLHVLECARVGRTEGGTSRR